MNKKNMWIITGIVLLMLIVYLIFNPTWITKPKYMLDKQYCEQDSECLQSATCYPINIYSKDYSAGICKSMNSGSECINFKCSIIPYEGLKK